MLIRHECDGRVCTVLTEWVSCAACGLTVVPAKRRPARPHGVVVCEANDHVVAACPLGETEADMADERSKAST